MPQLNRYEIAQESSFRHMFSATMFLYHCFYDVEIMKAKLNKFSSCLFQMQYERSGRAAHNKCSTTVEQ